MLMSLTEELVGIITKEKIGNTKDFIETYDTGLTYFDFRNGQYDPNIDKVITGLNAGSLTTVVGKSGSAKTSFLVQAACKIVEKYANAQVFHLDFERSTTKIRVQKLAGWNNETYQDKYVLLNSNISAESLYKLAKAVAKKKIEKRKELEYDTGMVDFEGNAVFELPPTIILLDSIAAMQSDTNNEEDELGGQMSATSQAKTNNTIIKRLIGSSTLEAGNIMIFAINHITTKIDINPMAKTAADLNFLKQNESLPGKR